VTAGKISSEGQHGLYLRTYAGLLRRAGSCMHRIASIRSMHLPGGASKSSPSSSGVDPSKDLARCSRFRDFNFSICNSANRKARGKLSCLHGRDQSCAAGLSDR
jgi:hypothetical protein